MKTYLSLIILLFICLNIVEAEIKSKDSIRTYNLGEVIVMADRDNIIKATSSSEIRMDEIVAMNATTIGTALSFVPGIHTTLSPKNEGQILLRGFNQTQVAIYLDGAPIYLPYDQLLDLDFLPTHATEKITISKSMPSVLYGPNAMGGIVNIVTKQRADKPYAFVHLHAGNSYASSVGAFYSLDKFYFNVSGEFVKSDGFPMSSSAPNTILQSGGLRRNSQSTKRSGFIKAGFQRIANIDAAFSLLIVDDVKGIPTSMFTSKPRYWRFTDWRKNVANLTLNTDISNKLSLRGNIFYEKFNNTLDAYDDGNFKTQTKPYAFHSVYDDDTFGANSSLRFTGFEFGVSKATVAYKNDRHAEMGNFNQPFRKYEIETYSIGFEQDILLINDFQFVIGIGKDWMRPVFANGAPLRSSTSLINGYLGVGKMVLENLKLYGHAARKSRFPAMKEFYAEILGRNAPNPNLNPEIALNTEFGAELFFQNINFRTAFFLNDVDGLIKTVLIDSAVQQYQNIGTAEFKGVEFEASYLDNSNKVAFSYTFLSAINTTKGAKTSILEYRPEHTLNITYNRLWEFGLSLTAEMKVVSSFYGVDVDTRVLKKLSGYSGFNFNISQSVLKHYSIFGRVNNLFDKFYQADYGFPQPGRNWIIGIRGEWR